MNSFGVNETVNTLSVDEMAIVFSFLLPTDILRARVCTTWRDAAKKSTAPGTLHVCNERSYNRMRVMTTSLPGVQQLFINDLRHEGEDDGHKFSDGEDPDEEVVERTADYHTHDINVISNFKKLRELSLERSPLNGCYPVLFNFPLLQSLEICACPNLKWDLSMLSGCPQLRSFKVLFLYGGDRLTGDLNNLRILRNTLEELILLGQELVSGNLMDLADFPYLKKLILFDTPITGDIRDIDRDDFPSIETKLLLPPTVLGGCDYEFQRISEVPRFMESIHPLLKREHIFNSFFKDEQELSWRLSRDSPDRYASLNNGDDEGFPDPPFIISFVRVGTRLGWRWGDGHDYFCFGGQCCEINWLDPEPSKESNAYDVFTNELKYEMGTDYFRGYYEPPSEEEYIDICHELLSDQS